METVILLKLGELVLKGQNRRSFEERLMRNAARRLGKCTMECRQSCLYITPPDGVSIEKVLAVIATLSGVATYTTAYVLEKSIEALLQAAPSLLQASMMAARTFKVEAKRADKRFALTSPQIAAQLGGHLHTCYPHLSVDVHHPDCLVVAEVREQGIYLHTGPRPGLGGLPTGVGGMGTLLISGGIDSPVAGFMMAKRGLRLHAVHFQSYPYTSEAALDKTVELTRRVAKYAGKIELDIVSFTAVQEKLRTSCPEGYFTLLTRRAMMRVAAQLAARNGSHCLITGESLGQVASQTVEALTVTNASIPYDGDSAPLPVFRPCIGMDKEEIVMLARRIDTFDTSILPYEDCCTVFNPKHPRLRPVYDEVLAYERKSELSELETAAVEQAERRHILWHW